jgi:hypothetical protein
MFFNIDNFIQNPNLITGNTLSTPGLSPFDFVHTYTSNCGFTFCESANQYSDGTANVIEIGNNWNQYHNGFISNQAAQYIFRKIVNTDMDPGCSVLCQIPNTLVETGPNCDERTLSFQTFANGHTYVWENLTPSLISITNGQNTRTVTVNRVGTAEGTASVRVTVTNRCGTVRVITRQFQIGAPVTNFTQLRSDHQKMYINVTPMPGATGYNYYIDGVLRRQNVGNAITYPNSCGVHIIGVQVIYPCGLSAIIEGELEVFCFGFRVSPNPATDLITVTPLSVEAPATQAPNVKMSAKTGTLGVRETILRPITELRLYDAQSRLMRIQKGGNGTGSLNLHTNGLPTGMYILEIYSGKEKEVRKIIIAR